MYLELLMRDTIVAAQQRKDIRQQTPSWVQVCVQTVDKSMLSLDTNLQQNMEYRPEEYRISFIRHCGYYFFAVHLVRLRLLFKGDVYFIGKSADSNHWNRYIWAIQIGMIDASISTCSLSVLLSAVEMSLGTCTALEIAQWVAVGIINMFMHNTY